MEKKIAVLYHSGCSDGFGGAYAAWKKFKSRAAYYPVEHQMPPPQEIVGKEIYMIDFCYPAEVLKVLKEKNRRIIILDHHKSAARDILEADEYLFDVEHSGAVIAWKYFFGEKKKIPLLLRYVEDNDLWSFKLKKSRETFAAISVLPFDFKVWEKVVSSFENNKSYRKKFVSYGENIVHYQEVLISRFISRISLVRFEGYIVFALNSSFLVSELGNRLALQKPPFSIIWAVSGNRVNVSLRSVGGFDVSVLAKKYGGGGHPQAAGFSFELTSGFPWEFLDKSSWEQK